MATYVGTWGLYPWGDGHDERMVHPDDVDKAKRLPLWGRVFECVDETQDYIVLHLGNENYRVKPALYRVLAPVFKPGNLVQTNDVPARIGTVRALGWHSQRQEIIYVINVENKQSNKWYWSKDLTRLS